MISGPELFFRYAQPPNRLGYCGPDRRPDIAVAASGQPLPAEELTALALAFQGAWPYLELIAGLTGRHPLSRAVVEAYWLGSDWLETVDLHDWGHSVSDRFRARAGKRWTSVSTALNSGGLPNHAFHVFCVYPWVGLLREGHVEPALEVLDRCRISMGRVVEVNGDIALVRHRPLVWEDADLLGPGETIADPFLTIDDLHAGDVVALHWDYVCQRLSREQQERLMRSHDRHLSIANEELRRARLEPAH